MAKKDQSFHDYVVLDLLTGITGISSRAMFGGWGIYEHGIFFALIAEGELYFKVDDSNRADFEKLESRPFVYEGNKGKPMTMSYWLVPEEIMEDRETLATWVARAVAVAKASKKKQ